MTFAATTAGVRHVETRGGDTLQAIAARELGDFSKWHGLAWLNGLSWPYLTDDPAAAGNGVRLNGRDTLLVPAPTPPVAGVTDDNSVFGTDIALVNGRLSAAPNGDIATVSGVANLAAALDRRLNTPAGELVPHPEFGNLAYTLIGRGGTVGNEQLAAAYTARALNADPRVASVSKASASLAGDALSASATAVTVSGKPIPVGTS